VGLIARGLEIEGFATTLISWKAGIIRAVKPPRALITTTDRGATMGSPHNSSQQLRILNNALELLKQAAPQQPTIDENGTEILNRV